MEERLSQRLAQYFRDCPYPVVLAYLFGSAARGLTTPLSDVDVAVYLDEPDRGKRVRFYLEFLTDLQSAVRDGELDLLYLNDARPSLAYAIISGRLLYCADERKRVEVESRILSKYLDEQDLDEAYYHQMRARILAGKMGRRSVEMIDKKVVRKRLDHIDVMLSHLKDYQALSFEEFETNDRAFHASLYELQTCLEAITDIGNHLIAAMGLGKPEERADIPALLAKAGIIPSELAKRLTEAVKMKNLIVHGYLYLLAGQVYKAIQEDLGDIEAFCYHIVHYLEQTSPEGS